jgi:hypothetical protein
MNNVTHNRRSGQSLVGVLVSVFILIGLAAVFLMPRGNKEGEHKPGTLKRSMNMATEVELNENIRQINVVISDFKNENEGKPPASLDELKRAAKGYPPEMFINPLDKKPLIYDPATGTICAEGPGCPAPGAASGAANPPAPGANPAAPAAPANPSTPGGMTSNIPQPGAGAAEALNDQ